MEVIDVICLALMGWCLADIYYGSLNGGSPRSEEKEWEERPLYLVKNLPQGNPFWSININTVMLLVIVVMVAIILDFVFRLYGVISTMDEELTD